MTMTPFAKGEQTATLGVRPAAVAGAFYSAQPKEIQDVVGACLQQARPPALPGVVRAVIAPHAGHIYSGPIAGYSFRALSEGGRAIRTVYLLGPAHYVFVDGAAVGRFRALATPLGQVPVATDAVDRLLALGPPFRLQNAAHAPEHSLEVELPFLQMTLGAGWQVVPILLGEVEPTAVAEGLRPIMRGDANAAIVISSDLSHFHPYKHARQLDTAFLDAVVQGDMVAVARGEACGRLPILALMHLAQALGWQPHLLDYRNSGDTAGDRRRVVGYGAVAYTQVAA